MMIVFLLEAIATVEKPSVSIRHDDDDDDEENDDVDYSS